MVEWFAIGNSPWGNPDASQIGMAAYWACLVIVPLIIIDPDSRLRPLKRRVGVYALIYTALALAGQWLIPSAEWRFAYHIGLVVLGYIGLLVGVRRGLLANRRQSADDNPAGRIALSFDLDLRDPIKIQRFLAAQHGMEGQLGKLKECLQVANAIQIEAG